MRKLMYSIERRIIKYILKHILKREKLVQFTDELLSKMETFASKTDETIVDDEIVRHLKKTRNSLEWKD